ncbi:RloB domain-containing protein [Nocardia jiangsuensis]|uniref:RloB domain-containing protein n=1 Tax=Nocardia jiangsuensis TaxID=1691563 RepID=A0ABV8DL36_9NOCA
MRSRNSGRRTSEPETPQRSECGAVGASGTGAATFRPALLCRRRGREDRARLSRSSPEESRRGVRVPDSPAVPPEWARCGVQIAFSHPSFGLWLLLHFQSFGGAQGGSDRIVHEKLRGRQHWESFSDRGDKSVGGYRAATLTGKHRAAARRAEKLTEDCPTDGCSAASGHRSHCDPLKRDPSTDVWRLLEALGLLR